MADEVLPHRKHLQLSRQAPEVLVLEKSTDVVALAKDFTHEAVSTLVDIARNGASETARINAATALLDRAHGKPGQSVTVYQGALERRAAWDVVDAEFTKDE